MCSKNDHPYVGFTDIFEALRFGDGHFSPTEPLEMRKYEVGVLVNCMVDGYPSGICISGIEPSLTTPNINAVVSEFASKLLDSLKKDKGK